MLIDCVSDLHGFRSVLSGGDVLIICGDLTSRDRKEEYDGFILWLTNYLIDAKLL